MKKILLTAILITGCSPLDEKFTQENQKELWAKVAQSATQEERQLLSDYISKKKILRETRLHYRGDKKAVTDEPTEYMTTGFTARNHIDMEKAEQASGLTVEKLRSKEEIKRSIVSNMRVVQVYLETYAVDWAGKYPQEVSQLYDDLTFYKSFQVVQNPVTKIYWDDKNNYGFGVVDKESEPCSPGLVKINFVSESKYEITGCDPENKKIEDLGSVYLLTNS